MQRCSQQEHLNNQINNTIKTAALFQFADVSCQSSNYKLFQKKKVLVYYKFPNASQFKRASEM